MKKNQQRRQKQINRLIESFHKRDSQRNNTSQTKSTIKFSISKIKSPANNESKSSFDILQKKEWILDWKCVKFMDGYFVVSPPWGGEVTFKPYAHPCPEAMESFNYLKDYLNERLSPVHCTVEATKLNIFDTIRLNEAIQKFAKASKQQAIKTSGESLAPKVIMSQVSFDKALSKAKLMSVEDFREYKSKYIDFLVEKQSKSYKIIPCVERLAHMDSDTTEYAFMFTLKCKSGDILIVHENVNPDRSTLIFVIDGSLYDDTIRDIYNFLQGAEINKRSSIREGNLRYTTGVLNYKSINHDDIYSWKYSIERFLNSSSKLPKKEAILEKMNFRTLSHLLRVMQSKENFPKIRHIFEKYNIPVNGKVSPTYIISKIPKSKFVLDKDGNKVLPIQRGKWSLDKLVKLL